VINEESIEGILKTLMKKIGFKMLFLIIFSIIIENSK